MSEKDKRTDSPYENDLHLEAGRLLDQGDDPTTIAEKLKLPGGVKQAKDLVAVVEACRNLMRAPFMLDTFPDDEDTDNESDFSPPDLTGFQFS